METWYRVACPSCNAKNWIDNGDTSDVTVCDVEAVKCWNCKHKFLLDDGADEEMDVDDGRCEMGRKSPDDPI